MSYVSKVILRVQIKSLKCCQSLEILIFVGKGFRYFHTGNIGCVGQRAAKLLAVKVGGLKKKSASRPRPQSASLLGFEPRSRFNHSQSLMADNFAAL